MSERRHPTFNHVAMTVPGELLEGRGRAEVLDFYGEVFGWTEMPGLSEEGQRLVLRAYSNEQFVFLVAGERSMQCGKMDHFGMSVATPDELAAMRERARKFHERDDRVEIVEGGVEDHGAVKLHSFYTRFRLPMMVEVQCFEWAKGAGPDSLPEG